MGNFVDLFDLTDQIYSEYKVSFIEHGEVHIQGQNFVKNPKGTDHPIGEPEHIVLPFALIEDIVQNRGA